MPILKPIKKYVRPVIERAYRYHPVNAGVRRLAHIEAATKTHPAPPTVEDLKAAIEWIKRAHDAGGDGGVSWGFRLGHNFRDGAKLGWQRSYPETTGYIIPTMLRYGETYGDPDAIARARRMTDWEIGIQLPDGGFQGGKIGETPVASSTFVTGQVLFGLVAAYEHFGSAHDLDSAVRAGDYLLSCLDDDGRFVRGYSHFCEPGAKAYEARTGLAMALLSRAAGVEKYAMASEKMAQFTVQCQSDNGWFAHNDLDLHDRPLTHTIGYVLEGLHGIGHIRNRPDLITAVDRTLDAIVEIVPADGRLAERWTADWQPTSLYPGAPHSICLTGNSQISGVMLRRCQDAPNTSYFRAAERLLSFVCHTQRMRCGIDGIDGGIRGSYPIGGNYGQYCTLNWATKFYVDSLLDYMALQPKAVRTD